MVDNGRATLRGGTVSGDRNYGGVVACAGSTVTVAKVEPQTVSKDNAYGKPPADWGTMYYGVIENISAKNIWTL